MKEKTPDLQEFPISKVTYVRGSRRLAREKALQILVSYSVSGTELSQLFNHIFFRDYKFGNSEEEYPDRLLRSEEIKELDSDSAIRWRDDDIEFAKSLINNAIENNLYVIEILKEISENWDFDRISIIDRTLIIMAVAELIAFPEIPIKVSINEAIEISKSYSTDKSTQFINGILDKFLVKLTAEGKVNKIGRGLV